MKRARRGALDDHEAQRLFHAALPDWDLSVSRERERMGYRPEWRPPQAPEWDGSRPAHPFHEWGLSQTESLDAVAVREVERLGLPVLSPIAPGAGGFVRYWVACFLSDYDIDHLSRVRDWARVFGGDSGLQRVYPPAKQTLSVVVEAAGPDTVPILTITGPVALVSRETLTDAMDRAMRLVPDADWPRHPLLAQRKARAGGIVRARPDHRHRLAAEWHALGKSSGAIAKEISARWPDETVEASTIRRWLRAREPGIS